MGSGKSVLARNLIENLNRVSYSNRKISQTEVIFISKSAESAHQMSLVCKKTSFKFPTERYLNIVKRGYQNCKLEKKFLLKALKY